MSLKAKLTILAAVPILAIVALGLLGGFNLFRVSRTAESVANDRFAPLINEDMKKLSVLQASVKTILEADRDAHQALLPRSWRWSPPPRRSPTRPLRRARKI